MVSPFFLEKYMFNTIIHSYTRKQAIEDGCLVDVSTAAKEAGFIIPVAITNTVYIDCVQWTESDYERTNIYQDESGRLWDLLTIASLSARNNKQENMINFSILRVPTDGSATEAQEVSLKLIASPGDSFEPVITIMLPDES
jgi:hypothetical protein